MSASKAAAAAAGRTLLKAGSRSIPAAARGGGAGRRGSKVARGLASVSLNQQQQQQSSQSRGTHGAMLAGASACAALVGVAALLEAEDLEGMLPAFLSERLQQQASPKALARIEEVSEEKEKSRYVVKGKKTGNTFVVVAPRPFFRGKRFSKQKCQVAPLIKLPRTLASLDTSTHRHSAGGHGSHAD